MWLSNFKRTFKTQYSKMNKTKELSYECEIFKTKVWMVPDITLWVTDVIIPFSMGSTPPSDDPLGIIE